MRQTWSFITNHALVLIYVVRHPESTVREISAGVGVTERAALAILRELDDEGIVERHRDGRRNTYSVNFAALVSYRREGTGTQPPEFIHALVRTLLSISPAMPAQHPATLGEPGAAPTRTGTWGFFTNHLLLLLIIARDPTSTVRDVGMRANITERAAVTILKQLDEAGIIAKNREGRRNSYTVDVDAFRRFGRWSPGAWQIPEELIDIAARGLRALVKAGPEGAVPMRSRESVTV